MQRGDLVSRCVIGCGERDSKIRCFTNSKNPSDFGEYCRQLESDFSVARNVLVPFVWRQMRVSSIAIETRPSLGSEQREKRRKRKTSLTTT